MRAKSILVSKTFWFNVVAALAVLLDTQDFMNVIPAVVQPYMLAIVTAGNVILRVNTVQPVAMKMPDATPPPPTR